MFNPIPDKSFEEYKKKINKEAFYKRLKLKLKKILNEVIQKLVVLSSIAYLFVMACVVAHFIIKFW